MPIDVITSHAPPALFLAGAQAGTAIVPRVAEMTRSCVRDWPATSV